MKTITITITVPDVADVRIGGAETSSERPFVARPDPAHPGTVCRINYDTLPLLGGVPIYGIVIGRGITAQPDPAQAAEKIAQRSREIWPA